MGKGVAKTKRGSLFRGSLEVLLDFEIVPVLRRGYADAGLEKGLECFPCFEPRVGAYTVNRIVWFGLKELTRI